MAGMTLVDSTDSILMLYSYAGFPESSWKLFEQPTDDEPLDLIAEKNATGNTTPETAECSRSIEVVELQAPKLPPSSNAADASEPSYSDHLPKTTPATVPSSSEMDRDSRAAKEARVKMNVMSGLSIILTLMSILVAFR